MPEIGRHQAICAEVIRHLREERKRRGLSNYAVAKRCGVSQSMLSLVERGLRNPTLETILKISDALEVDLSDIVRRATARAKTQLKAK